MSHAARSPRKRRWRASFAAAPHLSPAMRGPFGSAGRVPALPPPARGARRVRAPLFQQRARQCRRARQALTGAAALRARPWSVRPPRLRACPLPAPTRPPLARSRLLAVAARRQAHTHARRLDAPIRSCRETRFRRPCRRVCTPAACDTFIPILCSDACKRGRGVGVAKQGLPGCRWPRTAQRRAVLQGALPSKHWAASCRPR